MKEPEEGWNRDAHPSASWMLTFTRLAAPRSSGTGREERHSRWVMAECDHTGSQWVNASVLVHHKPAAWTRGFVTSTLNTMMKKNQQWDWIVVQPHTDPGSERFLEGTMCKIWLDVYVLYFSIWHVETLKHTLLAVILVIDVVAAWVLQVCCGSTVFVKISLKGQLTVRFIFLCL